MADPDFARVIQRINTSMANYTPPDADEIERKRQARLAQDMRHIGGVKHGNWTQAREWIADQLGPLYPLMNSERIRQWSYTCATTQADTGDHVYWYPIPFPARKFNKAKAEWIAELEAVRDRLVEALDEYEETT